MPLLHYHSWGEEGKGVENLKGLNALHVGDFLCIKLLLGGDLDPAHATYFATTCFIILSSHMQ